MPIELPLTTDRLRLRLHRPDDFEPLLAIYADPGVARYLLHEPWTRDDARSTSTSGWNGGGSGRPPAPWRSSSSATGAWSAMSRGG